VRGSDDREVGVPAIYDIGRGHWIASLGAGIHKVGQARRHQSMLAGHLPIVTLSPILHIKRTPKMPEEIKSNPDSTRTWIFA
jgi:hypothetical protein